MQNKPYLGLVVCYCLG